MNLCRRFASVRGKFLSLAFFVVLALRVDAATVGYWRFESAAFTQDSGGNASGPFQLTNAGGDNTNDSIALPSTGAGSAFPRTVPGTGLTNLGAARFGPTEVPPDSFSTPHHASFDSQTFTVEAFVNLAAEPGLDQTRNIASIYGPAQADRMFRLAVSGTSSTSPTRPSRALALSIRANNSSGVTGVVTIYFTSSAMLLTVGQDYYVAVTARFTGTGLQVIAYLKNLTANSALQSLVFENATYLSVVPSLAPFQIGAATGSGTGAAELAWDGVIDEVRYSNTFLAQSELLISTAAAPATVPVITAQPDSQSATAGDTVVFTLSASGNPTPTTQWRRNGVNLPGETSSTLILSAVSAASAGSYSAVVSNSAGSVTSEAAVLTVSPATPPVITVHPLSQTSGGGTVVFGVTATGSSSFNHQWQKNGVPISGATSALLILQNIAAADAGDYRVSVSNNLGTTLSNPATLTTVVTIEPGKLSALSIRGHVGTGADALIAGMIVESPVTTLIQSVGPTLGVLFPDLASSVLQNPNLEFYRFTNGSFVKLQTNDDWGGGAAITTAEAAAGATLLSNPVSRDSALLLPNLAAGVYTANVTGVGNTTGTVLLQAYAVPPYGEVTTLSALSIRGRVGTGGDALIAGIIISGSTSKTLILQAVGPTLGVVSPDLAGSVLTNPKLELYQLVNGAFVKIRENDDWGGDSQIAAMQAATGATVLSNVASKDSTLLVTLPPGVYTANVSGVNNTGGVVLLQAYSVRLNKVGCRVGEGVDGLRTTRSRSRLQSRALLAKNY